MLGEISLFNNLWQNKTMMPKSCQQISALQITKHAGTCILLNCARYVQEGVCVPEVRLLIITLFNWCQSFDFFPDLLFVLSEM